MNLHSDRIYFRRDFIINIPAPSNYIGPAKVFGLPAGSTSETDESRCQ